MTATRPRPWRSSLPAPISAQRPMQGNERANTLGLCSIRAKLVRGQGLCGRHRPSQRQGGGARRGGASGAASALLRSARPSAAQQCSCHRPERIRARAGQSAVPPRGETAGGPWNARRGGVPDSDPRAKVNGGLGRAPRRQLRAFVAAGRAGTQHSCGSEFRAAHYAQAAEMRALLRREKAEVRSAMRRVNAQWCPQ
jgi:hypothetical protein